MGQNDDHLRDFVLDEGVKHAENLEPDGTEYPSDLGKKSYQKAEYEFIQAVSESKSETFTYDPDTENVFNVFNPEHASILLERYSDGKNPLYLIAVTNHHGGVNRWLHSKHLQIQGEGKIPFFGKWLYGAISFTDISYPLNHGVSNKEIRRLQKDLIQRSVLVIYASSTIDFI